MSSKDERPFPEEAYLGALRIQRESEAKLAAPQPTTKPDTQSDKAELKLIVKKAMAAPGNTTGTVNDFALTEAIAALTARENRIRIDELERLPVGVDDMAHDDWKARLIELQAQLSHQSGKDAA